MKTRKIEGKSTSSITTYIHILVQRMIAGVPLWFFFWEHHDLLLGCMIWDDLSLWVLTTIEDVLMKNKIVFEKTSQKISILEKSIRFEFTITCILFAVSHYLESY